jgi:integrase
VRLYELNRKPVVRSLGCIEGQPGGGSETRPAPQSDDPRESLCFDLPHDLERPHHVVLLVLEDVAMVDPRAVAVGLGVVVKERGHGQRELRLHPGHGYVFTMDDGRPLHPQSVSRSFDRAISTAKLPRIRLHDLRHTHASLALAAGINPKVISERLGHATVSITLDTYSHAIPALQEEAAELIAGLVLAKG